MRQDCSWFAGRDSARMTVPPMSENSAPTRPFPPRHALLRPENDPWFILGNLIAKDFKVRYRNMSLGVFWSLLNPLIMMSLLTFVFTAVFAGSREWYPLFVLIGLLPFNFFALAWITGTTSIVGNASLIKQVPFQRELVPVSVVLANSLHYGLQLILLLAGIGYFVGVSAQWLWLPLVVVFQLAFVCGLALIAAALDVYFRDMEYVVKALTMVLFWMVPIFYGFDQISPRYAWMYEVNPIAAVVLIMRRILLYDTDPGSAFPKLALVSLMTLWLGHRVFVRMQRDCADHL